MKKSLILTTLFVTLLASIFPLNNYALPHLSRMNSFSRIKTIMSGLILSVDEDGWITMQRGESSNDFSFHTNASVYLRNKFIGRCSPHMNRLLISPISPNRRLALVLCTDEYTTNAGSRGYIVDMSKGLVLARNIVPKNWLLLKWVQWSPDEKYALVSAAGEVTMGDMAFIELNTGRMREIHFKDFTKGTQKYSRQEIQDFDLKALSWASPNTFQLRLDVRCNPYNDQHCNYDKILHSHKAQVALRPFNIRYEQNRITKSSLNANLEKQIRNVDFRNFTY